MIGTLGKERVLNEKRIKSPIFSHFYKKTKGMNNPEIIRLIEKSLTKGYTYKDYETLIDNSVAEGKSTSAENTEDLLEYSQLNQRRMQRLDKTLKLNPTYLAEAEAYRQDKIWLVLTESWCGDAAQALPVMQKLAERSEHISLRLILRDQHEELMNHFLTRGGKSIPKLIQYNPSTQFVENTWGPRPVEAQQLVDDYMQKHGALEEQLKTDMQVWYNKNKGEAIAQELIALLK